MKKTLAESKVIRTYILLWAFFLIGLFVANLFGETRNQGRNIGVASLVIGFGSLLVTLLMLHPVQAEIKARYPNATSGEKLFLTGLFYFVRGIFLLAGILILISSANRKDVLEKDLVEVGGKVSSIEVYGGDSSNLKIVFASNSNEYETRTFKIPDKKLEQIENEIQPGDYVFVLIGRDDENVVNNPYVQIYGVRTESYNYLSLDEYNKADSTNNSFGKILGTLFAGSGLIYLLTGRIKNSLDKGLKIEQNASRA